MAEFNPLNETHVAGARAAVMEAVMGLQSGELPFIDGVRAISSLRFRVPEAASDPDFLLFAAIDSETDHIPGAQARSQCSASWLQACDREASELAAVHADAFQAACERILHIVGRRPEA